MQTKKIAERSQTGARVVISSDHSLLAGKSGTIPQVPNSGAVVVELDDGSRELIDIEHLKAEVAPHLKLDRGGLVEIRNSRNPDIEAGLFHSRQR